MATDVGKVLTGRVFIGDFSTGIYSGYTMTAIKDFRTDMDFFEPQVDDQEIYWDRMCSRPERFCAHRDWFVRGDTNGGGKQMRPSVILYNYDSEGLGDIAYTAPDWATDFGPTWNDGDNWLGEPWRDVGSFSLDEVDDALAKQFLYGSYFNGGFGPTPHTFTLGAFTFPTKFLHFFFDEESGLPATTRGDDLWPTGDLSEAQYVRARMDVVDVITPTDVLVAMFGLEEESPNGTSPFVGTTLPWEVNLIPFGIESYANMLDFCFLTLTDLSSPFVDGITYIGGHWIMKGFNLLGDGDPRAYRLSGGFPGGYERDNFWLLWNIGYGAGERARNLIPISGVMFDYEFTNYPHARNFPVQWDNKAFQDVERVNEFD